MRIFRPEVDLRICLAGGGIEFAVRAEFRDLEDFDPETIEGARQTGPLRNDLAAMADALALLRNMRTLYEQPSVGESWSGVAGSTDQVVTDAGREIQEVTGQCSKTPANGIEFLARMTDPDRLKYTWKDALAKIDARIEALEGLRGELLAAIFERMRPIEVSYRQVGLFFENAVSPDDVSGRRVELAILNADPAVMADESKGLDEIGRVYRGPERQLQLSQDGGGCCGARSNFGCGATAAFQDRCQMGGGFSYRWRQRAECPRQPLVREVLA